MLPTQDPHPAVHEQLLPALVKVTPHATGGGVGSWKGILIVIGIIVVLAAAWLLRELCLWLGFIGHIAHEIANDFLHELMQVVMFAIVLGIAGAVCYFAFFTPHH